MVSSRSVWLPVAFAAWIGAGPSAPAPAGEPKVEVRVCNYAQLADFIQKNRGKVILVDMWNLGCPPCIQAMPHLNELHAKYASKGLVIVSLNLDNPKDEDNVAEVKALLTRKKMGAVNNIMLDEDQKFWTSKFKISGVPAVFLFDRDGKWHKYYEGTLQVQDETRRVKVEVVEAAVKALLAQPAKNAK